MKHQECIAHLPPSARNDLFISRVFAVWVLADFVVTPTWIDAFLMAGGSSVWTSLLRVITSVVCTPVCVKKTRHDCQYERSKHLGQFEFKILLHAACISTNSILG